jgi:DNA-binding NtrC family response regulator
MNQKGKIVVADDNKELCKLIIDILTLYGYEVDSVYDGYQLLAYLENNNPSVVILDLIMPEKGGISIFDSIKQLAPHTRIIIYTGYQEYKDSVYARKADRFLIKGSSVEGLVNAVQELT